MQTADLFARFRLRLGLEVLALTTGRPEDHPLDSPIRVADTPARVSRVRLYPIHHGRPARPLWAVYARRV